MTQPNPTPAQIAEARRLTPERLHKMRLTIRSCFVGCSPIAEKQATEEVDELIAEAEEAARLRADLDRYKEVHLKSFNGEPGQFTVEMRSDLIPIMGAFMSDCLDGEGAENVVEWTVTHPTKGPLVMSMRRKWGKTDLELRREAVEECSHWKANAAEMTRRNRLLRDRPDLPAEDEDVE